MTVRRVVTGTDARGKSVFLSDGVVPNSIEFASMPGQAQIRVWFSPGPPSTTPPATEPTDNTGPVVPGPGGASFLIVRYAPDSVVTAADFDPAAAGRDQRCGCWPDLAASCFTSSIASANRWFSKPRASPLDCWIRSASSRMWVTARS